MTNNEHGITWAVEKVKRDGVEFSHDAYIPVVTDLDAFRAEFGDAAIIDALDGSSFRVKCQEINRRMLAKGIHKPEDLKAACIAGLRGIRSRTVATKTVMVKVYVLAGGAEFRTNPEATDSENLAGLQAAATAAAIDAGVPADVARMIGLTMQL